MTFRYVEATVQKFSSSRGPIFKTLCCFLQTHSPIICASQLTSDSAMKLTFDEALQRINDQMPVHSADVQTRALQRRVWIAEWHLPGCLSESMSVCLTKRDAIDCALSMAEGADGAPRGMRADLQRFGRSDRVPPDGMFSQAITTIDRRALSDIL